MSTRFELPLTAGHSGEWLQVNPTETGYLWSAGSPPIAGGYFYVQEDGVTLPQRSYLNFINYFIVSDNAGNLSTDVDLDIAAIIAVVGGGSTTRTFTQVAHGFTVDTVLRSSGVNSQFTRSQANSIANSEVIGIVTAVPTANTFTLLTEGFYTMTTLPGGATAGSQLFLSNSVAGALTITEPTTPGLISKPVAQVIDGTTREIYWHNYRGKVQPSATPVQTGIQWRDEGINLGTQGTVDIVDFTGAGVIATRVGNTLTVAISSSGSQAGIQFQDEGVNLGTSGTATVLNFAGAGVVATRIGNTVTATISASASPLTTKGDLFTFTTVNARLPVGTNGQVLVADSAQATGLRWSTAGSGTTLGTTVAQVAHGLSVGQVIRSNGTANAYTPAQGNNPANAEAVGIVTAVSNPNNFTYVSSAVQLSGVFVPVGTPGDAVFLSPTSAGGMTTTKPTTIGQVVRALGTILTSGSLMYFDIAALGEEITSAGADNSALKVGVGNSGDIEWFNIQYPFYKDNGADSEYSFWELIGAPTVTSLAYIAIGTTDAMAENSASAYTSLLPDLDDTNGICKFNTTKQVIFQQLVKTFSSPGTNEGGCGFNQYPVTLRIFEAQGTNAISVGFVRDAAGQWYARTGNGAAFTETPISITDAKHVFRCEYDPGNVTPQARYYVDGILLQTITTTLPTASGTTISFSAGNASGEVAFDVLCAPAFAVEI